MPTSCTHINRPGPRWHGEQGFYEEEDFESYRGAGRGRGFHHGPGRGFHHGPGRGIHHGPGRGFHHGPGRGFHHGPGRGFYHDDYPYAEDDHRDFDDLEAFDEADPQWGYGRRRRTEFEDSDDLNEAPQGAQTEAIREAYDELGPGPHGRGPGPRGKRPHHGQPGHKIGYKKSPPTLLGRRRRVSPKAHPFTTPIGSNFATRRAIPAPSTASTTSATSL